MLCFQLLSVIIIIIIIIEYQGKFLWVPHDVVGEVEAGDVLPGEGRQCGEVEPRAPVPGVGAHGLGQHIACLVQLALFA